MNLSTKGNLILTKHGVQIKLVSDDIICKGLFKSPSELLKHTPN